MIRAGLWAAILLGASPTAAAPRPGVFVLGVDGMDPVILQRLQGAGLMPHFAALARDGAFLPLGTSNPPQSPVAWSTFVTGQNPGGHGIFDFIARDPQTHHPIPSATRPARSHGPVLRWSGLIFPLYDTTATNNRSGTPWWDRLAALDPPVDVEVYRIPGNYPVPESRAKVLSGMGTVDLRGGYGTYTLWTDHLVGRDKPKGDIQYISPQDLDLDGRADTVFLQLKGPVDAYRLEPGALPGPRDYLTVGLTAHLARERGAVAIEVGTEVVVLKQGDWSPWVPVQFEALPHGLATVSGIVRFYAQELGPGFRLYASPVNIAPAAPAVPISSPSEFAPALQQELGDFYTQGMPEDTAPVLDGVFADAEYLRQVGLVQQDTERMLDLALEHFAPGRASFVYVSDLDLQSHMLWRHCDLKREGLVALAAAEPQALAACPLVAFYTNVDRLLGKVRARLPREAVLIVMSDHGFDGFRRLVHLNAWLRDQGYLVLKDGQRTGQIVADAVDWQKTRLYNIGFNGLYLNLQGREAMGTVAPGASAQALLAEVTAKLEAWRDPKDGQAPVLRVYSAQAIYRGERTAEAPDLIVGFNRGFGNSDESTLGEITAEVLADNPSPWSGNHLMAPEVVPGVLLVNRPVKPGEYNLTDVTATILQSFGVAADAALDGRSFLAE